MLAISRPSAASQPRARRSSRSGSRRCSRMSPQTIASNEPGGNGEVEPLDVADPDLVEALPRRRGGGLVELDADDLGLLPGLQRLAQPARSAADVQDPPRRSGTRARTSGRAWPK